MNMAADIPKQALSQRVVNMFENDAADPDVVQGAWFPVDVSARRLRFSVETGTGGVVLVEGRDLHRTAGGDTTAVDVVLGTFRADGVLIADNEPRFDYVRASTITQPGAGTARVYLVRG